MKTRSIGLPALALATLVTLSACGEEGGGGSGDGTAAKCSQEEVTTDSGLKVQDVVCGEGAEAESGSTVSVHYVGTLESGEKFDSSRDRGTPFEFALGAGQVIPGWDEGVAGMRVGGTRKLTIPPDLGYGAQGAPPTIPPNSTLLFEIELIDVRAG